jgi:type VI secretion system secreted protein Hcp
MPIYMKIEGITGLVKTTGFEDQISLESVQWGSGRGVSSFTGTSREVSSPSISEMVITKVLDSASQALTRNAVFGDALPLVTISFVRDKAGGEMEAYMTYDLEQTLITSYSVSASSGSDAPMESLSLNFLLIKVHQAWRGDDYGDGGSDDFSYDIRTKAPV